jgi:WD40 repeat protein
VTTDAAAGPDVFVSYAEADREWVQGFLLVAFDQAGIRYHSEAQFVLGRPRITEFEEGIRRSDSVVLVLSPAWAADHEAGFVSLLARQYGIETGVWPVVPVVLHPVPDLPLSLSVLTKLDATDEQRWDAAVADLCRRLAGPPSPDGAGWTGRAEEPPPPCPYRGMTPLDEDDEIYGRADEIDEAIQRLRLHPWLAVIGPSGSGKSSLVRAGVVRTLRQRGHSVVTVRPGARPADALRTAVAAAPAPAGIPRLVVVDQLEELFTAAEQGEDFCRALLELPGAGRAAVLATVRADFYPQLMTSPLWAAVRDHRMEVLPLSGRQLREALVAPAASVRAYIEAALVERLMVDASEQPGALPLLQETMVCLWERLVKRYLPMSAYDALVLPRGTYGERPRTGLQIALSRRADQAMSDLPADGQRIARRILLRLVQFVDGREDVRRQQPVAALRSPDDDPALFDSVLALLTERRLVTVTGSPDGGDRLVDLAHEAMISGWPTFRGWLDERRAAERTRRQLEAKVEEWERLDGTGGLLDEVELRAAEEWDAGPDAAEVGRSAGLPRLIAASRAAVDAERRRKRRTTRAFQVLAGALAVLLVVALGAAAMANRQRAQAQAERRLARSGELALLAASLSGEQLDLALLLSQEAMGIDDTYRSRGSLLAALGTNPRVVRLLHTPDGVNALAVSPDGRRAVAGGSDGSVVVWDLATGRLAGRVPPVPGDVRAVAFAPDGRRIAVGGSLGTVQQFAADTGAAIGPPVREHRGKVRAVAYSPDGSLLATAGDDEEVVLTSVREPTSSRRLPGHRDWVDALAFAPDGRTLASGGGRSEGRSVDDRILLWDVPTGRLLRTLTGHTDAVRSLAFTPDGRQLVSGSADDTVRLWDVSGRLSRVLTGHTERVFGVAVSPDGQLVASAGRDHDLRVWDRRSGTLELLLRGHGESVRATAFAGKRTLLSAGNDGRVFVWDVGDRAPARLATVTPGQSAAVRAVAASPDGSLLVTGSDDGRVVVRDAGTGEPRGPVLAAGERVSGVAVAPDSRTVLTITAGGALDSWDVRAGTRTAPTAVTGDSEPVVAVSPDGRVIATGGKRQDLPGEAGVVRLWDRQLRPLGELPRAQSWVRGLAYRQSDGALAATGADGIAWLWTGLPDHPVTRQVNLPANTMTVAAFSPDGRTLAIGDADGGVVLWDPGEDQAKATSRPGLDGHEGRPVTAIAYAPNGTALVTADQGGTILLWDAGGDVPRLIGRLGHQDGANSATVLPSGGAAVVGTGSGAVRWDTDPDSWRRIACRVAGRNLQPVELSTALGATPYHRTCPDLPPFDRRPGQVVDDD